MIEARDENTKAAYERPTLVVHGTFEEITQANVTGRRLDATFAVETPVEELTFS